MTKIDEINVKALATSLGAAWGLCMLFLGFSANYG